MVKKTVTYEDYLGGTRTEVFYFNLTEAEVTKFNLQYDGGLLAYLRSIVGKQNGNAVIKFIEDILKLSYGEKSADGKRLMKSEDIYTEFSETEAYSKIFVELATDAKKFADFFNNILPKSFREQLSDKEPSAENLDEALIPPTVPGEFEM